jgi:hypothetical protein
MRHEYPRNPLGLVWDTTMADQVYTAFTYFSRSAPPLSRVIPEGWERKHVKKVREA